MIRALLFSLCGAGLVAPALAGVDLPPAYRPPAQPVAGRISVWGHGSLGGKTDFIETLAKEWERGFKQHHPDIEFENRLHGTASAIGALYTGVGDVALLGREIWANEVAAFKEVRGYAPTGVDVLTGSFDQRNRGYALAIFVHQDNPLTGLTLAQLDAIYSVDRHRGLPAVRTWGDLGLAGAWRDRPVRLLGFALARGFADYFADVVFAGSRKWNPELREFADDPGSKGGATDGGQKMLDALAQDRGGIAISGMLYRHPEVRPVAIARDAAGPFVAPTRENVLNHTYPFTRILTLYIDRRPGAPVAPHLREFLRYILSREAQQAVLDRGGGYLPMLRPFAEHELRKLD